MTKKCAQQWKEITELESAEKSPENYEKLKELKSVFTLLLSADYQMSKLLPFWGHTAQSSSTYYLKRFRMISMASLTINMKMDVYIFNEMIEAKNSDHSISYLMQYLK